MTVGDIFNHNQPIEGSWFGKFFGPLFDAFGRVRISPPDNRSDVEFLYDLQPYLFDNLSTGNGTVTHDVNARDLVLAVGGTDVTDSAHMRQRYHTPYTPGNSQAIDTTGTLDNAGIGGGTPQVFLRTSVTGSTVVHATNLDEADIKSFRSVSDWDWSKSQIFAFDLQSLKVGRIRFGIVRRGAFIPIHSIVNDNIRNTGYWQYANLPPYWALYNSGGNTIAEIGYGDSANGIGFRYVYNGLQPTATMRAICATVKSEGGKSLFEMPGFPTGISNGVTAVTVSTTLIPILSIRVRSTFNSLVNRALYIPTGYSVQTNNPIHYKILYRPTLTGASWVNVNTTYSGIEYDISASAVTGGIEIDPDYVASGRNTTVSGGGILGRTIMSLGATADILTIAAIRTSTSDASVYSSLKWKEIR